MLLPAEDDGGNRASELHNTKDEVACDTCPNPSQRYERLPPLAPVESSLPAASQIQSAHLPTPNQRHKKAYDVHGSSSVGIGHRSSSIQQISPAWPDMATINPDQASPIPSRNSAASPGSGPTTTSWRVRRESQDVSPHRHRRRQDGGNSGPSATSMIDEDFGRLSSPLSTRSASPCQVTSICRIRAIWLLQYL